MKIVLGVKLYDYEEVSRMLGVGRTTLASYVKNKNVATQTICRKKYLSEEEIKKLVKPQAK